jgi:hypothetical protein
MGQGNKIIIGKSKLETQIQGRKKNWLEHLQEKPSEGATEPLYIINR